MNGKSWTGRQFTRYVITGGINTAVTYALLVAALHWLHYAVAYTLVYLAGIGLAYWLQSRFVFRVPLAWRKALRFPLVYVAQYLLGLVALALLSRWTDLPPSRSALVVVALTVPAGFVLSRLLLAPRPAGSSVTGKAAPRQ
jgi:putative flippase GtrA